MRRSAFASVLCLAALLLAAARPSTGAAATAGRGSPLVSPVFEDDDVPETDRISPELRIVAAAPRAAITGKTGSVLNQARIGRTVNVETGDTLRFVAGLKEAVWYSGAGRVESGLKLVGVDPNGGGPLVLGEDQLTTSGAAPKIDAGRTRVDVPFSAAGTYPIDAIVSVSAIPRNGTGVNRTNRVPYIVTVWNPGELGEITGVVTDAIDNSPLVGFRVVAIDPNLRTLESVSYTDCDGSYELKRLPPSNYLVAVRGQRGFKGEFFDNAMDPNSAQQVTVGAGTATNGISFQLQH